MCGVTLCFHGIVPLFLCGMWLVLVRGVSGRKLSFFLVWVVVGNLVSFLVFMV